MTDPQHTRLTDHEDWKARVAMAAITADYTPEEIRQCWAYVRKHRRLSPFDLHRLMMSAHEDALARLPSVAVIRPPAMGK